MSEKSYRGPAMHVYEGRPRTDRRGFRECSGRHSGYSHRVKLMVDSSRVSN
jgi:hypothetical protein